jgi:hypothetical protein
MNVRSDLTISAGNSSRKISWESDEKKLPRKLSAPKTTVRVNPFFALHTKQTSESKILKEKEGGTLRIKDDGFPRIKTVKQVFATTQNKYSVGGASLPTHPSFRSPFFSSIKETENLDNKVKSTRSKTPRTLSPSTFNPPLPSILQTIQDIGEHLANFMKLYQAQLEMLHPTFEARETNNEEWKEHEKEIMQLAQQMLVESLGDEWKTLRQEMDTLLKPIYDKEEIEEDEFSNFSSINLCNLGLEQPLDAADVSNKSLSQTKKNIKSEKHLQVAFATLQGLIIDLDVLDSWNHKLNMKKMSQFINLKKLEIVETKEKGCRVAFTYIKQLILLGELLKQFGSDFNQIKKDDADAFAPLVDYAIRFVKHLDKVIRKKEADEKKILLDHLCDQFGECIFKYASNLAQRFAIYLKQHETLHQCLSDNLAENIQQNCLTFCTAFAEDLERAIKGKFLVLSSDKEGIEIPQISKAVRQPDDSEEYHQFCIAFLRLLMEHLNIDINTLHVEVEPLSSKESDEHSNLTNFNPLIKLENANKNKVTITMATIYKELEERWKKLNQQSHQAELKGVFKLLPILRAFNQNNILSLHTAMYYTQMN